MIAGGIMAGILRPISKTSITTHLEITCYADWICPALLVLLMELVIELYQYRGLNYVRHKGPMELVTGLSWGRHSQWHLGRDLDDWLIADVALDGLSLLSKYQQWNTSCWFCGIAVGRGYMNIFLKVKSSLIICIEKNNIARKQRLMCRWTQGCTYRKSIIKSNYWESSMHIQVWQAKSVYLAGKPPFTAKIVEQLGGLRCEVSMESSQLLNYFCCKWWFPR